MIIAFALLLGILPIIFWKKMNRTHNFEIHCVWTMVLSFIILFAHAVTYPISLNTIAEMETLYTNNKTVYSQAVEKFPKSGRIVTKNDATSVYLLSYDMVNSVLNYNTNLTWYRKYQNNWFLGGFVGKIPDNLEYLII